MDFISRLPAEVSEIVLGLVFTSFDEREGERFLGRCSLVCKTWNIRIKYSGIWEKIAKQNGFIRIGEYDPESGKSPKDYFHTLKRRLLSLNRPGGYRQTEIKLGDEGTGLYQMHPLLPEVNFAGYHQGKIILGL